MVLAILILISTIWVLVSVVMFASKVLYEDQVSNLFFLQGIIAMIVLFILVLYNVVIRISSLTP